MKNKVFILKKPYLFKEEKKSIPRLKKDEILVKILLTSICNADLRYYTGQRRKQDLLTKLPMALIHEGIGIIKKAQNKKLIGKKAILVPNISCKIIKNKKRCEICEKIGENYCPNSVFLSSGHNGFCQKYIVLPKENVIPISQNIPNEIAVMAELVSVIFNAYKKLKIKPNSKIALFGDGPLAYLVASFLSEKIKSQLFVFGICDKKLKNFYFAKTINSNHIELSKFKNSFDLAIECIGGDASEIGINQAINLVKPGSTILLMGVSENFVPINTRDILAKGLKIMGTSRSEVEDYKKILSLLSKKGFQEKIKKVIFKTFTYSSAPELKKIFDFASKKEKYWGKILTKMEDE